MLSDRDILRYLNDRHISVYTPPQYGEENGFDTDKQVRPGSIDLRVLPEIKRFIPDFNRNLSLDVLRDNIYTKPESLARGEKLMIKPGEIILASTLEIVILSESFAGFITGRSSVARMGLMVQCCQSFINPGHGQPIPLQLVNLSSNVMELDQDVPICQLILFKLATPSFRRYADKPDSKYANEVEPQQSKLYQDKPGYRDEADGASAADKDDKKRRAKLFVKKYMSPFMPAFIMNTLLIPFLYNRIASLIIPGWILFAAIISALYIWIRRDEK
jgi:dCTP deaminase